ncbi:hypothetical protein [Micromonospora sp. NPDC049107]|uniref:hypothetical protein n=1 Tax=unclassified Micromonospora TaxID=2617518 RepID=UPI0033E4EF24
MTTRYVHQLPACAHVEIGANLLATHDYLVHLVTDLSNTYGKTSTQAMLADRALSAVDSLRQVMENASSAELPGDRWASSIYRGTDEGMRQDEIQQVMEAHWADNPTCPCTANG